MENENIFPYKNKRKNDTLCFGCSQQMNVMQSSPHCDADKTVACHRLAHLWCAGLPSPMYQFSLSNLIYFICRFLQKLINICIDLLFFI